MQYCGWICIKRCGPLLGNGLLPGKRLCALHTRLCMHTSPCLHLHGIACHYACPSPNACCSLPVMQLGRQQEVDVPAGNGTGFIYDKQGHVVTNYHVIGG